MIKIFLGDVLHVMRNVTLEHIKHVNTSVVVILFIMFTITLYFHGVGDVMRSYAQRI
jgi:hypothetical protein